MSTTATAVSSAGKPVRRFPPPCWTQDEALALIQAYRERWYALRRGYLRTADWDAVAEEVGRLCPGATPPKTSAQCRHKIEKLRQRYRAEKQRAMSFSGGQFLSTWFYFDAMDSMEKNGTGSNHDEERNTGNDVNLKINDQLNTSIDPVYGGLNPGRGFRFKPVAAGPAGSQLVTVASRANNVRVSHNYVAQEEDNDDEIENAYYETLAGKNSGKRNTLASQNYASRFQPDYQNIESLGIRPRKFGKIGANVSHSHGYWNGTGDDDDDDDNDVGEDDVWVKMPKDRSSVSMDYNERINRGSGHHYFDGESEFSRGVKRESPEVKWPFPFVEGKLFVLTIRAGVDGFHINVGGRHVTSFPYRTGYTLEDATGLAVNGDVDVHSIFATSLPTSHPSFSPQRVIEMSEKWKARPLPRHGIRVFIGILSATNNFAERMAIRKTWMQSSAIKSSDVVVRFFVALSPRKEQNAVLKKEAAYFGDIVVLTFMDHYELVVLKTIAICEYAVQNVSASYLMKCDDDTFTRVDTILKELNSVPHQQSLYMGNLNLYHRPLRHGKWAVSFEEWPEAVYPPYANGPGYIISSDIAKFIVSQHAKRKLMIFKMEDVSMGMWVEQFNSTKPVQYSHHGKFCQHGCIDNYYTAHYQSPRQMVCLWDNLARGRARCCNFR